MNAFRDWLNTVFGADGGRAVQMILALLLVVLLLLGLAWLFRRMFGSALHGSKGGRLAVVEGAHVDTRRRLVLLRRDDVEHLVMIGGPNDLLVESRILRAPPTLAGAAAAAGRRPADAPADGGSRLMRNASTGVAAIGAAIAGAGAMVRARTGRTDEQPTDAPAAEQQAAPRRTVDMAFDAPLGRAETAAAEPRPRAPVARPDADLAPPPREPAPPVARVEPPQARPMPPMPQPAPRPAPEPMVAPPPAQVALDVPPPVLAPATAIDGDIERALSGLGRPQPTPPKPEPAPVPAPVLAEPAPAPVQPPRAAPRTIDDIDLLSELDLVVADFARADHAPAAPAPQPAPAPAPKIEPTFEPAPAPAAPAAPVAPVAPTDVALFEQRFSDSLNFGPVDEPAPQPVAEPAPAVHVEPPPLAEAEPEVPAQAKTPVDELEEEMARLLSELSGPMRR